MKETHFLYNHLMGRLVQETAVLVSSPVSLEHALWDGADRRVGALATAFECVRRAGQEPTPETSLLLLTVLAELTGQELSCEHLSHRFRMEPRRALQLLGAAENMGLWRHMKCFDWGDAIVNEKSKGYVHDVALACQMLGVEDPARMREHRSWGALFETFVVNRLTTLLPVDVSIFYWRTAHGTAEVDVVLQRGKTLYPIEIKSAVHVSVSNSRKIEIFTRFYEADYEVAPGLVVYTGERLYTMDNGVVAVPWAAL